MSKFAFLIGINYNGSSAQLSGCINDAHNMKNLLKDYYGYTDDDIYFLSDDTITPNKYNITEGFNKTLDKINNGCNEVWIHYSGHGSHVLDTNGDEIDNRDEVLCPVNYYSAGMITDDWLHQNFLKQITNENLKMVMVFDCCHSGTQMDLQYQLKNDKLEMVSTKTIKNGKIISFSGCRDDQYSADAYNFENNRKWTGAMSSAFINCLKSSNYNISCFDLLQNARNLIRSKGYEQIPQICCNFPIDQEWLMSYNSSVEQSPQQIINSHSSVDPRLQLLKNEVDNLERLLLITKNKHISQQQKYNQVVNEMNQARNYLSLWYRRFMSNRSHYNYRHLIHFYNRFRQAENNVNKEKKELDKIKETLNNIEKASENAKKTYEQLKDEIESKESSEEISQPEPQPIQPSYNYFLKLN